MDVKYKRVIFKISGEALAGTQKHGLDFSVLTQIGEAVRKCHNSGVEIGIVVGGGNFWRGRTSGEMQKTRADHMGMMATVINALGLADVLEKLGLDVRVQTAISMPEVAEPYIVDRAIRHLEKGRVLIFGCGTGSPFFSTDTAASLRAAELGADIILKATNVDGIYDDDPKTNPSAQKYEKVTFDEILSKNLRVMDSTAVSMCRDNNIPVMIFSLSNPDNIFRVLSVENIGTLVKK